MGSNYIGGSYDLVAFQVIWIIWCTLGSYVRFFFRKYDLNAASSTFRIVFQSDFYYFLLIIYVTVASYFEILHFKKRLKFSIVANGKMKNKM